MFGLRWRYQNFKHKWLQKIGRFNKGWDKRDAWNIDMTILRNLGQAMIYLGEHGISYPVGQDPEEWSATLIKHGNALAAGTDLLDYTEYELKAKEEALHWVAENFGDLWD